MNVPNLPTKIYFQKKNVPVIYKPIHLNNSTTKHNFMILLDYN